MLSFTNYDYVPLSPFNAFNTTWSFLFQSLDIPSHMPYAAQESKPPISLFCYLYSQDIKSSQTRKIYPPCYAGNNLLLSLDYGATQHQVEFDTNPHTVHHWPLSLSFQSLGLLMAGGVLC